MLGIAEQLDVVDLRVAALEAAGGAGLMPEQELDRWAATERERQQDGAALVHYAGSFLVAGGMCLLGGSWAASLVVLVLFPALFYATVIVEERMLQTWFGEEYRSYRRRVPRFIPALAIPPRCSGTYNLTRPGRELLHIVTLVCGVLMATELMELLHETHSLPVWFR